MKYSREFLEKTIEVWQPYYSSPLSLEDAQEIAENMISLYSLVRELETKHASETEPELKGVINE